MKLSLGVTSYSWPGGAAGTAGHLAELARQLDGAGIDTLWVPDHLLQMDPTATIEEPMLEAYTTLGFLAATTSHLRLGTMVTWASIRPPALLVKAVTTLDVLCGGRAWLGIGAGYRGDEAAMMGLPFVASERFSRLEETLELARRMWAGDDAAWQGPHHTFERPLNSPPPVARPKVLVGGMGSGARCRWSPAMPMRATCSTSPTVARRSGTRSPSWPANARPPAVRRARST